MNEREKYERWKREQMQKIIDLIETESGMTIQRFTNDDNKENEHLIDRNGNLIYWKKFFEKYYHENEVFEMIMKI